MEIYSTAASAPAPANVKWFQRALDRATKDRAISLRIIWGPDATKVAYEGKRVKSYAIPGASYQRVTGYQIVSAGQVVGHRSLAGIYTGSDKGLLVPITEQVVPCVERWIIEQKQHDQVARRDWEANRFMDINGLRIDRGPFPDEGIWLWFDQIEHHDSPDHRKEGFCTRCACCRRFGEQNIECIGQYRDPDRRDLNYIEACLKARDNWKVYRNPAEKPTEAELDYWTKKTTDAIDAGQEANNERIEAEVAEAAEILLNNRLSPKFDIGASFKKKDLCKKLIS